MEKKEIIIKSVQNKEEMLPVRRSRRQAGLCPEPEYFEDHLVPSSEPANIDDVASNVQEECVSNNKKTWRGVILDKHVIVHAGELSDMLSTHLVCCYFHEIGLTSSEIKF